MTDYAESLRSENGEIKYNLFAQNCGMIAQDILSKGDKDFAAGPGKGKQLDEQLTMIQFVGMALFISPDIAVMSLRDKISGDYLDGTIPDGAYYSGWTQTHLIRWISGWEAGDLEDFKDRFGGCDNET